jgi:subtilase family serine protease
MKSTGLGVRARLLVSVLLVSFTISGISYAQTAERAQSLINVQTASQGVVIGFTPAQIRRAYGFDQIQNQGEGQTIALVNAFDHPAIEQDFATFNQMFNLPPCTTANSCFRKVNLGSAGVCPSTDPTISQKCALWALEISATVEWAHAIAPRAKLVLVEAGDDQLSSLLAGVDQAVASGARVVSMSWGIPDPVRDEIARDAHFAAANVSFVASSGDFGHGAFYPAASPFVMGVGGTTLHLDSKGNYSTEKAWSGSGGGLSSVEPEPPYQIAYPIPNDPGFMRGTPDVAYDGDPDTGVALFDSVPFGSFVGWFAVGGTSIGPPQWAGLFAIANSLRQQGGKATLTAGKGVLYDAAKAQPASFNDVSNGKNGSCGTGCKAAPAYDYVTGLGTPRANVLIPTLVGQNP